MASSNLVLDDQNVDSAWLFPRKKTRVELPPNCPMLAPQTWR
jgi:hypothetical protein